MQSTESNKSILIQSIRQDAEAEAEKIAAEAGLVVEERLKNVETQIKTILQKARTKADETARTRSHKILSSIEAEKRQLVMRLKEQSYRQVLSIVDERLHALVTSDGYRAVLMDLVCEAALGLGASSAEVNASAAERALMTREFLAEASRKIGAVSGKAPSLRLSGKPPLESEGVVCTAEDGRTAYNNLMAERMKRKRIEIQTKIFTTLFEGE